MDFTNQTAEKQVVTTPKCSVSEMNRLQKRMFCLELVKHGANFYTMRDKLLYGHRPFDGWEVAGVARLIQEFAPDYTGSLPDFFNTLGSKADFVKYMVANGMGRSSCYDKFTKWDFKSWEIIGIARLADEFLNK